MSTAFISGTVVTVTDVETDPIAMVTFTVAVRPDSTAIPGSTCVSKPSCFTVSV